MTETQDHYFNRREQEEEEVNGDDSKALRVIVEGKAGGGIIGPAESIGTPTTSNTKSTTTSAAAFDDAIGSHHHRRHYPHHNHCTSTDLFDENECYRSAVGGCSGSSVGGRRGREGDDLLLMNLMSDCGGLHLPLQKKRRTCDGAVSPFVGGDSSSSSSAVGVSAAASISSSSSSDDDNETMKMTNETSQSPSSDDFNDGDIEIEVEPTTVTFPRNYEQLGDLYAALLTNVKDHNLAGIVDNVRDLCQIVATTTSTTNNPHDGVVGYGRGPTYSSSSSRTWGRSGGGGSIRGSSTFGVPARMITPSTTTNSYGYSSISNSSNSSNNPNSNHDGWSSLPQSLEIPSLCRGRTIVDGFDCGDDVDMTMDGNDASAAGTMTTSAGFSDHFQACSILLSLGCHNTIISIMKKNPDYSQLQYYCTRVLTEFLWVPTTTYASSLSKSRFHAADDTVIDGESYCYHPYIGSNIMEVNQDDDERRWENEYGMPSRSVTMKTTSGREEVYNAGGCTTVMQIFRRGSLESDINLQKAACQFLWTLLSSPSSPRGPQSSNRFVVEKFIRSTDDLSTLLYLALGRLCMSGGSSSSSTAAVGTMDKHQVLMDTATDLIQLVVSQCPVHLRSSAALYIHQYCRKMASRTEPHLEDSHFADWAVYNNDLFGRSTRLMKWIQEVQGEDGGWSIGDAGVRIMDADEVSYAADDFPPSSASHGFQRDEQYMME